MRGSSIPIRRRWASTRTSVRFIVRDLDAAGLQGKEVLLASLAEQTAAAKALQRSLRALRRLSASDPSGVSAIEG